MLSLPTHEQGHAREGGGSRAHANTERTPVPFAESDDSQAWLLGFSLILGQIDRVGGLDTSTGKETENQQSFRLLSFDTSIISSSLCLVLLIGPSSSADSVVECAVLREEVPVDVTAWTHSVWVCVCVRVCVM
jgi:hypothetical protein